MPRQPAAAPEDRAAIGPGETRREMNYRVTESETFLMESYNR